MPFDRFVGSRGNVDGLEEVGRIRSGMEAKGPLYTHLERVLSLPLRDIIDLVPVATSSFPRQFDDAVCLDCLEGHGPFDVVPGIVSFAVAFA